MVITCLVNAEVIVTSFGDRCRSWRELIEAPDGLGSIALNQAKKDSTRLQPT
ncbi:MAG: hypothetical protein AAGH78_15870 [Cyanobacteria bacterium P01_H01_bin.58]